MIASVEADDLTCRFGDNEAVSHVSFEIPDGSVVGIIGPSGSGKTTLIRLVLGLLEPTEGTVHVGGVASVEMDRSLRSQIGYLPQQPALLPDLSIVENLRFHASTFGIRLTSEEIAESLIAMDLSDHASTLAEDASGGMQRRVGLAAALVHRPQLIVLDEPTAGLDPILRASVWDRLRAQSEEGRTVIVTTQYVGEAANCDRVLLMREGVDRFDGTPDELRRSAHGGHVVEIESARGFASEHLARIELLDVVVSAPRLLDARNLSVVVDDVGQAIPLLSQELTDLGVDVQSIAERVVDFDEAFVKLVDDDRTRPAEEAISS